MQGTGFLLLAAVGGYWVLERASGHRGALKKVGQWVGGIVLAVSLIGVGCRVWALTTGQHVHHDKTGKGWYCPYHATSAGSPSAETK